jgi:hypothetical protein
LDSVSEAELLSEKVYDELIRIGIDKPTLLLEKEC